MTTNAKAGSHPDLPNDGAAPAGYDPRPPHDAVGAYLLDALPEKERRAFEQHLRTCPQCRREAAQLRPVVALLPRLLELDGALTDQTPDGQAATAPIPDPSADLRDRIVAAARADADADAQPTPQEPPVEVAEAEPPPTPAPAEPPPAPALAEPSPTPAPVEAADDAPAPAVAAPSLPIPLPSRPRGRIRPGFAPRDGEAPVTGPWAPLLRLHRGWQAAAVLAIVAVGALVWAIVLQGRVTDQRGDLRARETEIAEIRSRAVAATWTLAPTENGPSGATGTLYYSLLDQAGVLVVRGMPPLSPGQAYQLWYLRGENVQPGGIFKVDAAGDGVVTVPSGVPNFNNVALTAEPETGSQTPSEPILMLGTTNRAAG